MRQHDEQLGAWQSVPPYDGARHLYIEMPGAIIPPRDERGLLWGEVEETPEYLFCEAIARAIINTIKSRDAEREAEQPLHDDSIPF